MKINYIEYTSQGLVRTVNQDSIFSGVKDEYGLFVVADGMGGHFGGEIASRKLVESLKLWWNDFTNDIKAFDDCCEEIRCIINDVNAFIYGEYSSKGKICGTTVALLFIYSDRYMIINSGDTRIYCKCGFKIKQESEDHVFSKEAIISGKLTTKEALSSADKSKLTAAVGSKQTLKMYIKTSRLKGKTFFICSDGVYKFCKYSHIVSAMRKKDPQKMIIKNVEKRGARDNFSFIKIKII